MSPGSRRSDDRARRQLLARAAVAVWRSRIAWIAAASVLSVGILGAVYLTALYGQAISDECETWEPIDLPIEDVIALKQRKDAYQDEPTADGALWLTSDEATFLLQDLTEYGVRLRFGDHEVDAIVVVPHAQGCYNVHFEGELRVVEGVALISPRTLRVGDADLTGWVVSEAPWQVVPGDLPDWVDPQVGRALANTEQLSIEGGRVNLRLFDPYAIW